MDTGDGAGGGGGGGGGGNLVTTCANSRRTDTGPAGYKMEYENGARGAEGVEMGGRGVARESEKVRDFDGVIFVPHTQGSSLQKTLQKIDDDFTKCHGLNRTKYVERAGTTLRDTLVCKNPWYALQGGCKRPTCHICNSNGGKGANCRKEGACYTIECKMCDAVGNKTKYIGETSRSPYERMSEHMKLFHGQKEGDPDTGKASSVLWLHSRDAHGGEMTGDDWKSKIISSHRTALNRQVTEAILIQEIDNEVNLLNSKNEFGANTLGELAITKGGQLVQGNNNKNKINSSSSSSSSTTKGKKRKIEEGSGGEEGVTNNQTPTKPNPNLTTINPKPIPPDLPTKPNPKDPNTQHNPTQVRNDAKLTNTQPNPLPTLPQTRPRPPSPTIPTNPNTQTTDDPAPSKTSVMARGSLTGHPRDHKRSPTPLTPVRSGPPNCPSTPTHHNPPKQPHPNNVPNHPENPTPRTPTNSTNPTTQFQNPSLGPKLLLTGSGIKRKRDCSINGGSDSVKKMKQIETMCAGECRSKPNNNNRNIISSLFPERNILDDDGDDGEEGREIRSGLKKMTTVTTPTNRYTGMNKRRLESEMRRRKLKPGGRRVEELRKALDEDDRSQPRIAAVLVASWEAKTRGLIDDGGGEEEDKKKKASRSKEEDLEDSDDGKASKIKTTSDVGLARVKDFVINGERGGEGYQPGDQTGGGGQ